MANGQSLSIVPTPAMARDEAAARARVRRSPSRWSPDRSEAVTWVCSWLDGKKGFQRVQKQATAMPIVGRCWGDLVAAFISAIEDAGPMRWFRTWNYAVFCQEPRPLDRINLCGTARRVRFRPRFVVMGLATSRRTGLARRGTALALVKPSHAPHSFINIHAKHRPADC